MVFGVTFNEQVINFGLLFLLFCVVLFKLNWSYSQNYFLHAKYMIILCWLVF
jgi:hypothetical protein